MKRAIYIYCWRIDFSDHPGFFTNRRIFKKWINAIDSNYCSKFPHNIFNRMTRRLPKALIRALILALELIHETKQE
jgi:hypothetical protein